MKLLQRRHSLSHNGRHSQRRGRRGVLTMELVLTLPILLVMLLGMFEFTLIFYSRGQVVEASRAAARKASLPGVTDEDVEAEVRRVLSPTLQAGVQIEVDLGERSGDLVAVSIEVPMTSASPDLLWPIGVGLDGRNLYSETRMVRE
jgi:Flp pilus assembly protein TadG